MLLSGHNGIHAADDYRHIAAARTCGAGCNDYVGMARLPLDAIMHNETYHDYTPASIDSFYAEKEALEESKEFCRINNKQTLAQVFTDCRYTKKDNEAMSAGLMDVLRKQGFLK